MVNLTLKNIPEELYETLKAQAKSNHRSINSEVIYSLKKVLGFRERADTEEVLGEVRSFRQKINITMSEEEIDQAKRTGRE